MKELIAQKEYVCDICGHEIQKGETFYAKEYQDDVVHYCVDCYDE